MAALRHVIVIALLLFGTGLAAPGPVQAEPAYAKWGRLALQETAKRYDADIIDYKHLGRRTEQNGVVSEAFKLLLKKDARKFGVTVRIWFEHDTERVVRIQFTDDGRSVGRTEPRYRFI